MLITECTTATTKNILIKLGSIANVVPLISKSMFSFTYLLMKRGNPKRATIGNGWNNQVSNWQRPLLKRA